ncbi:MAG: alkaline phosphatase D family protein [Saprospiraceae bacterium]|nr:alkaline phosphatase family protein [Saprospiraceae bacterium]MCB9345797.1 alkaline phosphatase family protein [Lewinellaceae bacterium]
MNRSHAILTVFLTVFLVFVSQAQDGQTPKSVELTERSVDAVSAMDESAEVFSFEMFDETNINTAVAPTIIAFGSCNKINMPQTMWQYVAANDPQLWIWLGDIIYADTTNMLALAAQYRILKSNSDYKKLRDKAQIVGIYDDHDYGYNDACKDYPKKELSKKRLLNFLDVPMNSPVRSREGAYQSYTFGKGEQSIKVIVMDLRYFRDELEPDPGPARRYYPNMTGNVLGEAQWKWLENELRNSTANLNILCSSVQVISNEHGYEKWGNFPNERKRLFDLLVKTQPKNLMIVSGDRHMAEISKMDIKGLPYPLYDFTSSGLTHTRSGTSENNMHRVGDMFVKKNFGILKVKWNGPNPIVNMEIRGQQNHLYQEMEVKY